MHWPIVNYGFTRPLVTGTPQRNHLKDLPPPVFQDILNLLGIKDLTNVARTDKYFEQQANLALKRHLIENHKGLDLPLIHSKLYLFFLIQKIRSLKGKTLFENHPLTVNDLLLVVRKKSLFETLRYLLRNKQRNIPLDTKDAVVKFLKILLEKKPKTQQKMLLLLKAHGADLDKRFDSGWTLLTFLINHTNTHEFIKFLCENKANVNLPNAKNQTPLYLAILKKDLEVVKILLKYKADPNLTPSWNREEPLALALRESIDAKVKKKITSVLLKHGANPNSFFISGFIPLTLKLDTEFIELLCQAKAKTNIEDRFGRTPLHAAIENENLKAVKVLLKYGADAQLKTSRNETSSDFVLRIKNSTIREQMLKLLSPKPS